MKIIKQGVPPEEKEYQTQCYNCKTIFVFTQNESIIGHDRDGPFMNVNCPLCKQPVYKGF